MALDGEIRSKQQKWFLKKNLTEVFEKVVFEVNSKRAIFSKEKRPSSTAEA